MKNPEYSRRHILAAFGALGATAIIGCGPEQQSTITSPTPTRPEPTPIRPEGLPRLISSVELVVDPFIKAYLKNEILPIYQQSGPFIKDFGGLTFNVASGTIKTGYAEADRFLGTFAFQTPNPDDRHVIVADDKYYMPALSTVRASEMSTYASINGEPVIPFTVEARAVVIPNLRPQIEFNYPGPNSRMPSDTINKIMQFIAIKEACSHMLFNSYLLNVATTMKRLGLPTHIKAINPSGQVDEVNIVAHLANVTLSQQGRSLALIDIGGAALAFRALAGTGISEANIGRTQVTQNTINAAAREFLGGDIHTVFPTVVNFIMNNPTAEPTRYSYAGDLNKLP